MALNAAQKKVASALKEQKDLPDSIKKMLLHALPHAFGADVHEMQQQAAQMIKKALADGRVAAGEAQEGGAATVKEAQTVLEALKADVEASLTAEREACDIQSEKAAALEVCENKVKEEQKLVDAISAEKTEVAAEEERLQNEKSEVETIQNGSFRTLADGGWADEEVRDACFEPVCSYLSTHGADPVLMAALQKTLLLKPEERTPFDRAALDEASKFIAEKVAECTAAVTRGQESFSDFNAEYLGAWAIFDVARDEVRTATEILDEADRNLSDATVAKKLARSKVTDQEKVVTTLLKESTSAETKVQQLDDALAAVAQLEAGDEAKQEDSAMDVDASNENAMTVDETSKDMTFSADQIQGDTLRVAGA
jgi:hypothetical protein